MKTLVAVLVMAAIVAVLVWRRVARRARFLRAAVQAKFGCCKSCNRVVDIVMKKSTRKGGNPTWECPKCGAIHVRVV